MIACIKKEPVAWFFSNIGRLTLSLWFIRFRPLLGSLAGPLRRAVLLVGIILSRFGPALLRWTLLSPRLLPATLLLAATLLLTSALLLATALLRGIGPATLWSLLALLLRPTLLRPLLLLSFLLLGTAASALPLLLTFATALLAFASALLALLPLLVPAPAVVLLQAAQADLAHHVHELRFDLFGFATHHVYVLQFIYLFTAMVELFDLLHAAKRERVLFIAVGQGIPHQVAEDILLDEVSQSLGGL